MQPFTSKTLIALFAAFFIIIASVVGVVSWKNRETTSKISGTQNQSTNNQPQSKLSDIQSIRTTNQSGQTNAIKQDFPTIYYADIQADRNRVVAKYNLGRISQWRFNCTPRKYSERSGRFLYHKYK